MRRHHIHQRYLSTSLTTAHEHDGFIHSLEEIINILILPENERTENLLYGKEPDDDDCRLLKRIDEQAIS